MKKVSVLLFWVAICSFFIGTFHSVGIPRIKSANEYKKYKSESKERIYDEMEFVLENRDGYIKQVNKAEAMYLVAFLLFIVSHITRKP